MNLMSAFKLFLQRTKIHAIQGSRVAMETRELRSFTCRKKSSFSRGMNPPLSCPKSTRLCWREFWRKCGSHFQNLGLFLLLARFGLWFNVQSSSIACFLVSFDCSGLVEFGLYKVRVCRFFFFLNVFI